jgi:histidinol-phosphate phosphatase family protein
MNKEVFIIMGYNASGKSSKAAQYERIGYHRLNRDIEGGTIDELAERVAKLLGDGINKIVLDNTYPTIASRASVINAAKSQKAAIHCIHLTTSLEESQMNACLRMIRTYGKLLSPEEIKAAKDPNTFPPAALFHYRKQFQAPSTNEGFDTVENLPFLRSYGPEYKNKALILDYDGTLRESTGPQKYPSKPDEILMLPGRIEVLKLYEENDYLLLGASNQSGIARGSVTREAVVGVFEETNNRLGLKIDYNFCPHPSNPVICYCRKPSPGMAAVFIEKYKLDPAKCIMIGDMTSDKTFATRSGFDYIDQKDFFG